MDDVQQKRIDAAIQCLKDNTIPTFHGKMRKRDVDMIIDLYCKDFRKIDRKPCENINFKDFDNLKVVQLSVQQNSFVQNFLLKISDNFSSCSLV